MGLCLITQKKTLVSRKGIYCRKFLGTGLVFRNLDSVLRKESTNLINEFENSNSQPKINLGFLIITAKKKSLPKAGRR